MKIQSIKSSKQITLLKNSPDKLVGKFFLLIKAKSLDASIIDFVIIASKKVGNAVVRNKVKRRLRYLIKTNTNIISPYSDYLFIVKKSMVGCEFGNLQKDFIKLICKKN